MNHAGVFDIGSDVIYRHWSRAAEAREPKRNAVLSVWFGRSPSGCRPDRPNQTTDNNTAFRRPHLCDALSVIDAHDAPFAT